MKRLRGFRVGGKLVRGFRWVIRPRKRPSCFISLDNRARSRVSITKILGLARFLQLGAKALSFRNSDRGYIQLGKVKPAEVPKGHLAVYVGESDGGTRREVVPVIYFNHPLFEGLLKEAEQEYGYNHAGGIKIPCGYSEFEKVKMRIERWDRSRRSSSKHHKNW